VEIYTKNEKFMFLLKNEPLFCFSGSNGLGMPPDYMASFGQRALSDFHAASTLSSAELALAFESMYIFLQ